MPVPFKKLLENVYASAEALTQAQHSMLILQLYRHRPRVNPISASPTSHSAPAQPLPGRVVKYRPMALALLCGLGCTVLLFAGVSRLEQDKVSLAFMQRAHARLFVLQQGVDSAIAGLGSVNQLFASREHVSRKEFHLYTRPILARAPYVQGISHLRIISHAERAALEAELAAVVPGTVLTEMRDGKQAPAGERASYRVIEYIEPMAGNQNALGLDTAYPVLDGGARQQAYDSGQPTAGKLVRLAQGPEPRLGVIVSMPEYRYGAEPADAAARRAALVGETAMVLRPADMIEKIYAAAGLRDGMGLNLRVYAGAEQDEGALVFESLQPPPAQDTLPRWLYPAAPARLVQPFDVAG
jgi:CHASE1-domain containing sensor protein